MNRLEEVTLREHFEIHCAERTARQDRDVLALKELIHANLAALDKRLETLNNFRDAMRDLQSGSFSRAEHEQYAKAVEADLRPLRDMQAVINAKASWMAVLFSSLVSIGALLVALYGSLKH
jgi:DNA-directed RNA polymerase sigma subunit (sigma70/sigma32)